MDHKDYYNDYCKDQFTEIRGDVKKILKLLMGNGEMGLIDNVRENTNMRKRVGWFGKIVVGAFVVQSIALLFFLIKNLLL